MDEAKNEIIPGGPPRHRQLDEVRITTFAVSDMANNVYILQALHPAATLVIDAADDAQTILRAMDRDLTDGAAAPMIVTTHSHWDHHRALAEVVEHTRSTTFAGRADVGELPVPIDVPLDHGDTISLGSLVLDVIGLRGHTAGSIALAYQEPPDATVRPGRWHIFTGDSLFPGGVGATPDHPSFSRLLSDVTSRIFDRFPDDTIIYPGHGAETTLGEERPQLGEWAARGW